MAFRNVFIGLGRLSVYVLPLIAGVGLTYLTIKSTIFAPVDSGSTKQVSFIIEGGWKLKDIAKKLEQQKIVRNWWSIDLLSKLKKFNKTITAGEYMLSPGQTPSEILDAIFLGKVVFTEITIPSGLRANEIIKIIAASGLVSEEQLRSALTDRSLMDKLSIPGRSFEGYLFPAKYRFTRPVTAESILTKMLIEGRNQISDDMINRTIDLGFRFHEILTLASILELEASQESERALISSTLHNRLRIGMPLQSDPTVRFGLNKFSGPLTQKDVRTPGSFNTYLNTGLPPFPICNPSLESMRSALEPADTDYLYFVRRADGTHVFSSSLKEHTRAVAKNQAEKPAE